MKIVGAREGWAAPSNGRGQWDGGKVRNGGRVPRCREGRWQRRRERTERARGDPGERRGRAEAGGGRGAGPLDGRAWLAGWQAGGLALAVCQRWACRSPNRPPGAVDGVTSGVSRIVAEMESRTACGEASAEDEGRI